MRVELVGGLGIGKTTLCKNLEVIGFNCIMENLDNNPFLADCYDNPEEFRFASQSWFALSKFQEIRKKQNEDLINVVDQGLLNIRAYNKVLFKQEDREALHILNQTLDYFETQLGRPDLIVHLKCSVQEQMTRIRSRAREYEGTLSMGFVAELQREINMMIAQARAEGVPVLTIDTEEVFIPGNMAYAERLAREISQMVYIRGDKDEATVPQYREPANDKTPLLQYIEMAEAV